MVGNQVNRKTDSFPYTFTLSLNRILAFTLKNIPRDESPMFQFGRKLMDLMDIFMDYKDEEIILDVAQSLKGKNSDEDLVNHIIESNAIERFIKQLKNSKNSDKQIVILYILINICSSSQSSKVKELIIWCLGNIIGDNVKYGDLCLEHGILDQIAKLSKLKPHFIFRKLAVVPIISFIKFIIVCNYIFLLMAVICIKSNYASLELNTWFAVINIAIYVTLPALAMIHIVIFDVKDCILIIMYSFILSMTENNRFFKYDNECGYKYFSESNL